METQNWSGQIICNRKRTKIVNFRAESDLVEQLQKIDNKSKLIREAVREKLEKFPLTTESDLLKYQKVGKRERKSVAILRMGS